MWLGHSSPAENEFLTRVGIVSEEFTHSVPASTVRYEERTQVHHRLFIANRHTQNDRIRRTVFPVLSVRLFRHQLHWYAEQLPR